jgi:hypothetical protein
VTVLSIPGDQQRSAREDEDNTSDRVQADVQHGESDPTVRWSPPNYKSSVMSWGEQLIRQEYGFSGSGPFESELHDPHGKDSRVRGVYEQLQREDDPLALKDLSSMNADEAALLADRINQRLAISASKRT